nr:MAG TPA: hypothetical protein [Caudoviricetes sp.]
MEKKIWNQNLVDKYDNIMMQLYATIGDILREKLGEEVIINYEGGECIVGKLEYVGSQSFAISYGKDIITKHFPFSHMQAFPFYEGNNIDIIADRKEW